MSLRCPDGTVFQVATGGRSGDCDFIYFTEAETRAGELLGAKCSDGRGNAAYATCELGCLSVTGTGECERED